MVREDFLEEVRCPLGFEGPGGFTWPRRKTTASAGVGRGGENEHIVNTKTREKII